MNIPFLSPDSFASIAVSVARRVFNETLAHSKTFERLEDQLLVLRDGCNRAAHMLEGVAHTIDEAASLFGVASSLPQPTDGAPAEMPAQVLAPPAAPAFAGAPEASGEPATSGPVDVAA